MMKFPHSRFANLTWQECFTKFAGGRRAGFIYFMRHVKSGAIKIGFARDESHRRDYVASIISAGRGIRFLGSFVESRSIQSCLMYFLDDFRIRRKRIGDVRGWVNRSAAGPLLRLLKSTPLFPDGANATSLDALFKTKAVDISATMNRRRVAARRKAIRAEIRQLKKRIADLEKSLQRRE